MKTRCVICSFSSYDFNFDQFFALVFYFLHVSTNLFSATFPSIVMYKFPTTTMLATQILDILIGQIEIERKFSIVGILIALCNCYFQTKNLDKLIFVSKNWPSNPHVRCPPKNYFASTCEVVSNIIEELDVEFEHKVECNFFPKA